ncbi:GNAT family N-acetyltransferase [Streptomyces sp. NPDC048507]|uniref:GNAT family N-acetyltransferase n=1 Tax=Streptomyces sp. NPDC048507 TaxID=3365560 RepID=UPI0037222353
MTPSVTLRCAPTAGRPALLLRPWRRADVPALRRAYADPVLRRRTRYPVDSESDGLMFVEDHARDRELGTRYGFAVLEEEAGLLVGATVLKRPAVTGPSAEVGYWTAAHARGLGVAPRALEALTAWAFGAFAGAGLERLDLLHQEDNEASCRVAVKSGYGLEGRLPAAPPEFPLSGHLHVRRRGSA